MMQKPLRKNPYLLLAGATLLFYLPVVSLRFAIKNDLFTGYFPARFHLSTFLHEGIFPLWDPWINYGLPLYGDITATAWNPLTILIASTIGYNAYTITFEVLLALFTAGAAMYALCIRLGFAARASLLTAMAYMACGYFIGDLQHLNWVWGAALLPWCASGFLRFTASGKWKDLPASLLPFFLFMTAAHPGLMIGAAYFFLCWLIALCLGLSPDGHTPFSWTPARRAFILLSALVLVSLGLAYGYGHNLALTTRGGVEGAGEIGHAASTLRTWISLLLPLSTVRSDTFFATDVAVRNGYIGLLPLVSVLFALLFDRNRWTLFWTFVILLFILISGEHGLSAALNRTMPLLGQVRLKGEFRIFALLGAFIMSATQLHRWMRDDVAVLGRLRKMFVVLFLLFSAIAFRAIVMMFASRQSIVFTGPSGHGIKAILDALQPADLSILQSVVQALICLGFARSMAKERFRFTRLMILLAIDLTLASWFNLPFTGVGSRSVADMQALVDRSPGGIPVPANRPTREITSSYPLTDSIIGNWGLYSKQNAWAKKAAYPMVLSQSRDFFPGTSDSLIEKALVFSEEKDIAADTLLAWTPDHIAFRVHGGGTSMIGIKQNHHPGWSATIDGQKVPLRTAWSGLNAVEVPAGGHLVELRFRDPLGRLAQAFHFSMFLLLLVFVYVPRRKDRGAA